MAATTVQLDEKHTLPLEGDLQPDDAVVKIDHDVVVTEEEEIDLYKPLPPLEGVPEEASPLTFRACFVGICLGTLVNASNVYLGRPPPKAHKRSERPADKPSPQV